MARVGDVVSSYLPCKTIFMYHMVHEYEKQSPDRCGSANSWGLAIHLASRDGYENAVLPSGYPVGTPEEALDCACGLYLNDPTAWLLE